MKGGWPGQYQCMTSGYSQFVAGCEPMRISWRISRREILRTAAGSAGLLLVSSRLVAREGGLPGTTPTPYGALPSARHLAWHELETYGFLHFTTNTFTDREWGMGDEDPALFNPTDFSAEQIVASYKAGGLKQLIVTAKHHDGFCLWPSRQTDHTIARSPYQGGRGDIVGELAAACARQGLKFGVYLSPWDRNNAEYGRPGYVRTYHGQLRELLTQYGKIHEVWFDGANGGDGYYGGARETRKIDAATYYQWDAVRSMVRELQPDAVIFADEHMDVRWVGNEQGVAGDPCWPTMDEQPFTMQRGNSGIRGGKLWNPAEVNTSIRPGWFWHPDEDDKVRSPANLIRVYFESVGRGTNLLLNVPPDRRGRIHETDARALKGFRDALDRMMSLDLAKGAKVTASSVFSSDFAPANVLSPIGSWAAREDDRSGAWLALRLPKAVTFNVVRLREAIEYGARIDKFAFDVWQDGAWRTVAEHSCLGRQRLIRLEVPITARQVRLRIIEAAASPVLAEFGLHLLPDLIEEPAIERDAQGLVSLRAHGQGMAIFYSLDGSQPGSASHRYSAPFALLDGGIVRAIAVRGEGGAQSAVASKDFDVAPKDWRVLSATGDKPENLIKGGTFIGPAHSPVDIVLDLGRSYDLKGFTLRPVVDYAMSIATAGSMGPPAKFTAWVSADGQTWGAPAGSGEFANIAASRSTQRIRFESPRSGRYLRLELPHATQDKPSIGIGAIGILTR
jgi:alpha-L-fucosidase